MTDQSTSEQPTQRQIRSYVLREGRITPGQKRAMTDHWSEFGIEPERATVEPVSWFPRSQPVVLEIGFGMGDSLFQSAQQSPELNFIGAEVHRPGVGHLLGLAAAQQLQNLRVFHGDSVSLLQNHMPCGSLKRIQIFFPDPWHKKKHHKRRLISPAFAEICAKALETSGVVHVATDWAEYAEVIAQTFAHWQPLDPPSRPQTKYERRGLRLDHEVFDLAFTPPV